MVTRKAGACDDFRLYKCGSCSSAQRFMCSQKGNKRMILNDFLIGLGIKERQGAHLQHSQLELQNGAGQVFGGLTGGRTH